jgi:hypothetical protein
VPSLSAENAFAALDHATAAEQAHLLHATPNQLAVGVTDSHLGWLEVRAERVAGQLTAQVTADSTASHAALTASLPAMAGYLHEQRAGVQYLAVSSQTAGNSGQGGQSASHQNASGNGGQQSAGDSGVSSIQAVSNAHSVGSSSAAVDAGVVSGHEVRATTSSLRTGHQVSVRA